MVVIIKLGMDLQIKEDKEENVKYGTNFNSFIKVIITFTSFNSCSKAVFSREATLGLALSVRLFVCPLVTKKKRLKEASK